MSRDGIAATALSSPGLLLGPAAAMAEQTPPTETSGGMRAVVLCIFASSSSQAETSVPTGDRSNGVTPINFAWYCTLRERSLQASTK